MTTCIVGYKSEKLYIVVIYLSYHESVSNVDDKSVQIGTDWSPFVVDEHLESTDCVLVKNG